MSVQWNIQVFDTLSTTQDLCKEQGEAGVGEGLVIQALEQTAGRGRHGRVWTSVAGNLYFSMLLKPGCEAVDVGQVSILCGVALAEAIDRKELTLKWPNDVFLGGRKCAGILIDSALAGQKIDWLVVGVGVNTAEAPEGAGALHVNRDAFLQAFLGHFEVIYALWQSQGFAPIREKWLKYSFEKGAQLNVGNFEDLDMQGNLVVRDGSNALKTISAGDVYLKDSDYAAGH